MRVLRITGLTLVFLAVVVGWVFVVGILRYGSVEDFGLRVRRAVAWSRPPAEVVLPAPALGGSASLSARLTALPPAPTKTPVAQVALPTKTLAVVSETAVSETVVSVTVVSETAVADAPIPEAPITDVPVTDVPVTDALVTAATATALTGLRHEWQTWNNCGPATLATYLSYYGSASGQAQIGSALRRSEDDKNVSPEELHAYAVERGMRAILRVNGSSEMLRTLVSNGYPVLIETWLEESPNEGMGHYRLMTGYDDARQAWILYDSYVSTNLVNAGGKDGAGDYAGIWGDYAQTEAWWKVFNRTWLLVYQPEDEAKVQALLGEHAVEDAWQGAEARAHADLALDNSDAFAWFNLGSSLWNQGRAEDAAAAFDQARTLGLPWRMLWYQFGIFPTYLAVGRADEALALADATLANTSSIEEIHFWQGEALRAQGNPDGARAAYQRALALYPGFAAAQTALAQVE